MMLNQDKNDSQQTIDIANEHHERKRVFEIARCQALFRIECVLRGSERWLRGLQNLRGPVLRMARRLCGPQSVEAQKVQQIIDAEQPAAAAQQPLTKRGRWTREEDTASESSRHEL